MAAGSGGGGSGTGPGSGPGGARRGSGGRDAEAEVWCRRVRELVSAVPANRLCFECGQRGVTYVDISVGSLVCTGCSGALRGLNPPHRVKSISMTTFTEAEVLFLQAHGNEACRRVWLGTFDPRTWLLPDSHDPQKLKEFLQEKYEKKRWYVAPEQVKPPQSTAAEPPQLLTGDKGTQLPPQPAPKAGTDLLGDIGEDPFASPAPGPAFAAFPAPSAFPSFNAFGTSPGAAAFGGAVLPFHIPPPTTGYTNPFMAPRPSTNPFQSDGPAAAFTSPPVPGRFPSPFQAEGSPLGAFSFAKASTNPFVTVPAPTAPFSIRHPSTNPFL